MCIEQILRSPIRLGFKLEWANPHRVFFQDCGILEIDADQCLGVGHIAITPGMFRGYITHDVDDSLKILRNQLDY